MAEVTGKSSGLRVLLSSTPTSETWRRCLGLIGGDDVTWRGDSNETLLHLVASSARTSSYVDLPVSVPVDEHLRNDLISSSLNSTEAVSS